MGEVPLYLCLDSVGQYGASGVFPAAQLTGLYRNSRHDEKSLAVNPCEAGVKRAGRWAGGQKCAVVPTRARI